MEEQPGATLESAASAAATAATEKRPFPPWSVWRVLGWITWFVLLSILIGGIFGVMVTLGTIWFNSWLSHSDALLIARLPAQAIYGGVFFLFILSRLRKAGSSLHELWGSFWTTPEQLGLALFSGAVFMSTAAMVSKLLTGEVDIPPTEPVALDWRLLLGAEVLVNALITGVEEEMAFRGLLYRALRQRLSVEKAVLLSALLFTVAHLNLLSNPVRLVFIFLFGIIAALLLERTRSLTPCIAFHIAANSTLFTIYYLTYFTTG